MKRDHRLITLLLVIGLVALTGASWRPSVHEKPQAKCPVTKVTCPDLVYKGDKLMITAQVNGGDPNVTPTYNWSISAGTIKSGQGTPIIEVNTKEVDEDSSITATVDIGGFDRECGYGSTAASCTTSVGKK